MEWESHYWQLWVKRTPTEFSNDKCSQLSYRGNRWGNQDNFNPPITKYSKKCSVFFENTFRTHFSDDIRFKSDFKTVSECSKTARLEFSWLIQKLHRLYILKNNCDMKTSMKIPRNLANSKGFYTQSLASIELLGARQCAVARWTVLIQYLRLEKISKTNCGEKMMLKKRWTFW